MFKAPILFALIFTVSTADAFWFFNMGEKEKHTTKNGFTLGNNPGVMMRFKKDSIQGLKDGFENFYPHYINYDAALSKNIHFDYGFFFDIFSWHFRYQNITYDGHADFDIRDAGLELITVEDVYCEDDMWGNSQCYDKYLLDLRLPIIERWKIQATQEVEGDFAFFREVMEVFDDQSPVVIDLENIEFSIQTDLFVDKRGYLEADIWQCNFDFGSSHVEHHDDRWAYFIDQAINLWLVVMEHSCSNAGEMIFKHTLAPLFDEYMHQYQLKIFIPSLIRGQNVWELFKIDYRNVKSPWLQEEQMDVYIDGGLIYNETGCVLDPEWVDFHDGYEDYSQVLITEDAATCWANQIAVTPVGKVRLNKATVNAFFDNKPGQEIEFTTTSLKKAFPILEQRYGPNKDVDINFSYRNATVKFGQYDADMTVDFQLSMAIGFHQGNVFEDTFNARLSADIVVQNDVLHFKLLDLHLKQMPNSKKHAEFDEMHLTVIEYENFKDSLHYSMSELRKTLNNDYFRGGILLPYNIREIDTSVVFKKNAMYVLLEVNEGVGRFFEDEFWDEDALRKRDY